MPAPKTHVEGFRRGYLHVVHILDLACEKETHLNPHVRKILNQAIATIARTLREELDRSIQETFYAQPSQTPIQRLHQAID